ncbi:MAG: hypothetical protein OXR70_00650, partial [Candidatus Marinimicrobia bacterium]|nr:hypothetical protein [Candidatus Neomarinimicrobiota bacterium]
ELKTYNEALLLKPIVLVRTKGDTLNDVDETKWESIPEYLMEISSVAQTGLTELVREISNRLNEI